MLNKVGIVALSIFLLLSCATRPEEYLKKTIYNKEYITKVKTNIVNNNLTDEEKEYNYLFKNKNIPQLNRDMYRTILEKELGSKYIEKKSKEIQNQAYPVLARNNPQIDDRYLKDNSELRAELDQIKTMLNRAKNEMTNYTSGALGRDKDNSSDCGGAVNQQKTQSSPPY